MLLKKKNLIILFCFYTFSITENFNKENTNSVPKEFFDQINRMENLISQLPENSIAITNAITYLKNNCDQIQVQIDQERKIIEQKQALEKQKQIELNRIREQKEALEKQKQIELDRIKEQKEALEKQEQFELTRIAKQKEALKKTKEELEKDIISSNNLGVLEIKTIEELNLIIKNKNGILLFLHYQEPENSKFLDQLNCLNEAITSLEFKNFLRINENITLIKVNSLISKQIADLLVDGDSHQIDPWIIHPALGIRVIQKGKIVGKYKAVGDSKGTHVKTIIKRIKKYIENIRKNFNNNESNLNLIIENINNINDLSQILFNIKNGYLITCIYKDTDNKSNQFINIKRNINNIIFDNFIKEFSSSGIIKVISLNIYHQYQKNIADTILSANSDIEGMHPIIFIRKVENNNLVGCPNIIGNQNNCNTDCLISNIKSSIELEAQINKN
jgi:hypothetical protein